MDNPAGVPDTSPIDPYQESSAKNKPSQEDNTTLPETASIKSLAPDSIKTKPVGNNAANQTYEQASPLSAMSIDQPQQTQDQKPKVRSLFIILAAIAVLGALAFAGYTAYTRFLAPQEAPFISGDMLPGGSENLIPPESNPQPSITNAQGIAQSHNKFGVSLLKTLFTKDSSSNIVISPSSIALALSMVKNGADGTTKTAMDKVLQIEGINIDTVNKGNYELMAGLKNPDPKVVLEIANSIWARKGMQAKMEFLQTNEDFYGAVVDYLDFNLPTAPAVINAWVSENTNGKIPAIVPSKIPADVVMYLINAIYFNGTWTYEFDKTLTSDKEFTTGAGTKITHPMMSQKRDDFMYLENDELQAIALPYGENKRLRMLVFLPKGTISDFVSGITPEKWNTWLASFSAKEGTILMPKYKIEYEKSLVDSLSSLGMSIAFSSEADFTKIADGLFISDVLHKTYIDVNEEGTEAAAVTSVVVGITSEAPSSTFYMEVNKPFLFAIQDETTREILFFGIIQEPK